MHVSLGDTTGIHLQNTTKVQTYVIAAPTTFPVSFLAPPLSSQQPDPHRSNKHVLPSPRPPPLLPPSLLPVPASLRRGHARVGRAPPPQPTRALLRARQRGLRARLTRAAVSSSSQQRPAAASSGQQQQHQHQHQQRSTVLPVGSLRLIDELRSCWVALGGVARRLGFVPLAEGLAWFQGLGGGARGGVGWVALAGWPDLLCWTLRVGLVGLN